jgi:hypothetical protein
LKGYVPASRLSLARVSGCTVGPNFALSVDVEAPSVRCFGVAVGAGGVRVGYLRAAFGAVEAPTLLADCATFEVEDPMLIVR